MTKSPRPRLSTRTHTSRLYERVARELASSIAKGDYPIGDRLPSERDLAIQFSVSRPTIREAIIALELDGLVEVKMNSGVYVIALAPKGNRRHPSGMGPFELLEARRVYESETCGLAAQLITDADLSELERLIGEMQNAGDVMAAEAADRSFHLTIARATQNSAMVGVVETLWDYRERSAQYKALSDKVRAGGLTPRISEHTPILDALKRRDGPAAKQAMWNHLTGVIDALLQATDVHALSRAQKDSEERLKSAQA